MTTTSPSARKALGRRIYNARKGAELNREQLAQHVGVSRQAVHQWEIGATSPAPEHQERVAEILGVEWADLFRPSTRRTVSRSTR